MDYLISNKTLFLEKNNTSNQLLIKEIDNELTRNINLKKLIDDNCKYYGSSYIGRKTSSKFLLNKDSKVPIILIEKNILILFSLVSDRKSDNIWLVFNNIIDYKSIDFGVEITFKNNIKKTLNCSYYVFNNQYLICCKLYVVFLLKMQQISLK